MPTIIPDIFSSRKLLIVSAWTVTIFISTVPDIFFVELLKLPAHDTLWYSKLGLLLFLVIGATLYQPLKPLRNFFLVVLAFFGLSWLRSQINFQIPVLQSIFGNHAFDGRMQAEQFGKFVVSLATITLLLLLGYRKNNAFLSLGNLKAPMRPVRWLGFPKADPWPSFGIQWSIYIAGTIAIVEYFSFHPAPGTFTKLSPVFPSILFYAALNSFNEEITYRVSILTTLEPVLGYTNVLWLSAFYFGIAHYYGIPGGIVGGIASIFMGWILGKSVLETRGLFWALWIHFLSDVAIFSYLAISL